jgi:hypothetical protein
LHPVLVEHTSVLSQTSVDVQSQSAHVPVSGPLNVPRMHMSVESHQPHSGWLVRHASHAEYAVHRSGVVHMSEVQAQPVHDPVVGPEAVPVRQLLDDAHQPQPERGVHAPQLVELVHGSVIVEVMQTPPLQARPEQQSASVRHVCEPVRHAQRPPEQSIQPQHCALEVHVAVDSAQQTMPPETVFRQLKPEQHDDIPVHDVVAPPHIMLGGRLVPLMHVSPAAQGEPVVQHGVPSAPVHVGVVHELPTHDPIMQTVPHAPQFRPSVRVSTHEPLQHVRPLPVHESPEQHDCPAPPHVPIVVTHVPAVHVSPMSHVVPSQHGCVAPPHAIGALQTLSTHS